MISMNKVFKSDSLAWMRSQPDDAVDLVFMSPQYEDARTYGIEDDSVKLRGQSWVDWFKPYVREACRLSKGLVAIVVEGKTRKFSYSATPFLLLVDLMREGFVARHPVAFNRVGIPGSGGPDWLRNDWEPVICFSKPGRLAWSDNKACGKPPKYRTGGASSNRTTKGDRVNQVCRCIVPMKSSDENCAHCKKRILKDDEVAPKYVKPKIANPGNVVRQTYDALEAQAMFEEAGDLQKINVGGGRMGDPLAHKNEAPFPESLAEFFVKSFCPPGGVVLDPFCGSGTTCAVAWKNDRNFIGVDVRESQVELTRRRIAGLELEKVKSLESLEGVW